MWCLLLSALVLGATASFDSDMTRQEKKETGVTKLNRKEKKALQAWIDLHYSSQATPATPPLAPGATRRPLVEENLQGGHYIRLSDQTMWEIDPQDVLITQGWLSPVEISVSQTPNQKYPYTLTNMQTGSSVRAKKVEEIPPQKKLPPSGDQTLPSSKDTKPGSQPSSLPVPGAPPKQAPVVPPPKDSVPAQGQGKTAPNGKAPSSSQPSQSSSS